MKSDQRSDHRIKPSIADDIGEGSFPRLMVVVTDQEAMTVVVSDICESRTTLGGVDSIRRSERPHPFE